MKSKEKMMGLFIAVILAIVSAVAVSGLLSVSKTVSNIGTVKAINVEVYWDLGCTLNVSTIDWGMVEPGENITKTVYVKNTGNAPLVLSMYDLNWNPVEAGNYITLSWDREGVQIEVDEVLSATILMSVSDAISGVTGYSFDLVIHGEG